MLQNKKNKVISSLFQIDLKIKNTISIQLQTFQSNLEAYFEANQGFTLKKKQNSQVLIKAQEPLLVELTTNHIIFKEKNSKNIIGFVQCSFDTKFQIIKLDLQSPSWQKLMGIRLINQFQADQNQRQIQIFINQNQTHKFMEFLNILQRKNLVQLNFHSQFRAVKRIRKGLTAYVYEAVQLRNKKRVAIKSFKKSSYFSLDQGKGKMAFRKEMQILSELNHPGLGSHQGVYETENSIYIIFNLFPISLFNFLKTHGLPSQEFTKKVIKKLLIGLQYLHSKEIIHRDIKLDNVMLKQQKCEDPQPIIIDFGLGEYINSQNIIYQKCGTPGYVAPEILNQNQILAHNRLLHKKQSDIFSLGVIFYIMITGKSPFQGSEVTKVLEANKKCEINYKLTSIRNMSSLGFQILKMMLDSNPLSRVTASQALNHPYFADSQDLNLKEQLRKRMSTQISISI